MFRAEFTQIALMAIVLALMGCSEERAHGSYVDGGKLVPSQGSDDRWQIESGAEYIVWLRSALTPTIPMVSESTRQTTVWVVFPSRPKDGERVDLAASLTRYEYGGQALTWVSQTARGSLVLETRLGTPHATIDATFTNPLLGTGEQTMKREQALTRFTLP